MKVFVTGATGCLGSRITNDILSQGHKVKALIRKTSDKSLLQASSDIEFVEGDIMDEMSLETTPDGCDAAVHCAAGLHFVPRTQEDIERYDNVNVGGTKRVLETCIKAGVKHFVHMGSIASMGDFYNIERDETFPCTPESYYGRSKLKSEEMALSYHGKGTEVTVLRPGVIYGAADRGTILKMIRYIHNGKFHFIGNGKNYKSIVSVGNVSAATIKVLLNPAAYGETFIVVDKEKLTIREIANTMADKLGVKVSPIRIPLTVGYALGFTCDILGKFIPVPLPFTLQNVKNFTHSATYSIRKIQEKIGFDPPEKFHDAIDDEINWYLNTFLREHGRG